MQFKKFNFFAIGSETAQQGSKPALLNSCELISSVDGSGSESHGALVDVDCEISTSQSVDTFNSRMVKMKQMAHKGADFNEDRNAGKQPRQGIPATFPHKGKPTGKAVSHMVTYNEDEDYTPSEGESSNEGNGQNVNPVQNANLQQAMRAGHRRRTFGGKARVYKRAPGKRHYKPGIKALKEIAFYQLEYGLLCSKLVSQCLFREICQDLGKTDLHWQLSACMALQEGYEAYLVALFKDGILECIHGKRKTVMPKDLHVALHIHGEMDKYANCFKIVIQPKEKPRERREETDMTHEY